MVALIKLVVACSFGCSWLCPLILVYQVELVVPCSWFVFVLAALVKLVVASSVAILVKLVFVLFWAALVKIVVA